MFIKHTETWKNCKCKLLFKLSIHINSNLNHFSIFTLKPPIRDFKTNCAFQNTGKISKVLYAGLILLLPKSEGKTLKSRSLVLDFKGAVILSKPHKFQLYWLYWVYAQISCSKVRSASSRLDVEVQRKKD